MRGLYGISPCGAVEDTDHQDFNQYLTIRKVPAKTLAEVEQDNRKAMDPQAIFGNRSGPEYLGFSNGILILPLLLDALTNGSDLKASSSRERQS